MNILKNIPPSFHGLVIIFGPMFILGLGVFIANSVDGFLKMSFIELSILSCIWLANFSLMPFIVKWKKTKEWTQHFFMGFILTAVIVAAIELGIIDSLIVTKSDSTLSDLSQSIGSLVQLCPFVFSALPLLMGAFLLFDTSEKAKENNSINTSLTNNEL